MDVSGVGDGGGWRGGSCSKSRGWDVRIDRVIINS